MTLIYTCKGYYLSIISFCPLRSMQKKKIYVSHIYYSKCVYITDVVIIYIFYTLDSLRDKSFNQKKIVMFFFQ